jgi:hypothetical protein
MMFPTALRSWRSTSAVLLLLVAAYAVAGGPAARLSNADSLIPVFVSLESWTLFYWGQDRFGMLLPLLAMCVTDGFWNLMVQNILTVALLLTGVACMFARLEIRQAAAWALLTLAVLLAFHHGQIPLLLLTTNQSYGPSLGLSGLAIYLLQRATWISRTAAVTLMVLAAWTNGGVALFVACVALTLVCVRATRAAAIPVFAGAAVSIVAHGGLQHFASGPMLDVTRITIPAVDALPSLVWAFWEDAVRLIGRAYWVTMGVTWIAAGAIAARREMTARPVLVLCGVGSATFLYGSAMAAFFHGVGRHIAPAIPLIVVCPLMVLARAVPALGDCRWLSAGLLFVVVLQTGLDWPRQVRQQLVERLGQGRAVKLYTNNVTAVTGDYWRVWPWTFAVNLLHEARDGRRPVLPVTRRAELLIKHRRADVKAGSKVAIVPSGALYYWMRARLPRLLVETELPGYALGTVGGRAEDARGGARATSQSPLTRSP